MLIKERAFVLVEIKYGSLDGGWRSYEVMDLLGVGLWMNIRRGWIDFTHFTRFLVVMGPKYVSSIMCSVKINP